MGNRAKRDTRAAETQEKRHQALELRKRGLSYRQVAQALSCSVSVAHEYVESAIAAIPREAAEDVRRLELERVDRMIAGAWPGASSGDPKSIFAVVKLMERRAKYLGLDAPSKVELAGDGGGPIETKAVHDDLLSRIARQIVASEAGTNHPKPEPQGG